MHNVFCQEKAIRIKTQCEWPYLISCGKEFLDLLLVIGPPVLVQVVPGLAHLVRADGLLLFGHLQLHQLEKLETGFEFPPILFQDLGRETLDAVVNVGEPHFLGVAGAALTS